MNSIFTITLLLTSIFAVMGTSCNGAVYTVNSRPTPTFSPLKVEVCNATIEEYKHNSNGSYGDKILSFDLSITNTTSTLIQLRYLSPVFGDDYLWEIQYHFELLSPAVEFYRGVPRGLAPPKTPPIYLAAYQTISIPCKVGILYAKKGMHAIKLKGFDNHIICDFKLTINNEILDPQRESKKSKALN